MIFPENYVDGQVLFELTEKELLDIIKPIGIVKNILSLTHDQVPSCTIIHMLSYTIFY